MNQTIDEVAENWYSRLNKLKVYHEREDLTVGQKLKSIYLITILADRLMRVAQIYIQMKATPKHNTIFPSGGISVIGEQGTELFIDHKRNEAIISHARRTLNYTSILREK